MLSRIDAISSVSGGSIMAAHLADRVRPWPEAGDRLDASEWNSRVAEPFYALASRDLRTWPILKRLLPWNWFRTTTAVETLASLCERHLTRLRLPDLPDRPLFTLCATDMVFGVNWIFRKDQIGDYQAGYVRPARLAAGARRRRIVLFPANLQSDEAGSGAGAGALWKSDGAES